MWPPNWQNNYLSSLTHSSPSHASTIAILFFLLRKQITNKARQTKPITYGKNWHLTKTMLHIHLVIIIIISTFSAIINIWAFVQNIIPTSLYLLTQSNFMWIHSGSTLIPFCRRKKFKRLISHQKSLNYKGQNWLTKRTQIWFEFEFELRSITQNRLGHVPAYN